MVTFSYDGPEIQSYVIEADGLYRVSAAGAQGGTSPVLNGGSTLGVGGNGAEATAELFLTSGTVLDLLVGGTGGSEVGSVECGGGGGSFVVEQQGTRQIALLVGGGGGGATYDADGNPGGLVGTSSAGGAGILNGAGAGGGGFLGDGEAAYTPGAASYIDGGTGGVSVAHFSGLAPDGDGGFGGGGAGGYGGGGGGGYGGGAGGSRDKGGNGGSSYIIGSAITPLIESGFESGNGEISISLVACYCKGTLIQTNVGELPIEELRIGDLVVTASGGHRPIKWIGRRSYFGRFLAANPKLQPVRFIAGSLGAGIPSRDLLVSYEHAMFIAGKLIPAHCLANELTIIYEQLLEQVNYFHLELESHDIIFAERAPSETYVDRENRHIFENAVNYRLLHPDEEEQTKEFCAPRVIDGFALEAIRKIIELRSEGVLSRQVPLWFHGAGDLHEAN